MMDSFCKEWSDDICFDKFIEKYNREPVCDEELERFLSDYTDYYSHLYEALYYGW